MAGLRGYGGYKDEPLFMPAPLWQGFYAGGSAGWAWTDESAAVPGGEPCP